MFAGSKCTTKTILLAAASAVLLVGCDSDQGKADRQVKHDLQAAREVAASGDAGAADAARKSLEDAEKNADASNGMKSLAKSALAQAELDAAHDTIRKIDHLELDLARVTWEMSQLAQQIRTSGSTVVGYQKYDPKPAREAIATKIQDAQGGPGKPVWFQNENATIPTLSAVKQEIARIEGEIAQRQDQVKSIDEQRKKLTEDAEAAAAQADQLKGDEAVQVFKRSSDLRKQAGDKAVDIEKVNSEIGRFQRDLSIAQGQQSTLNEVIAQLQDQAAALDAGWKEIDAQVAKQQQLAAQILGAGFGSPAPATQAAEGSTGTIASSAVATAGKSLVGKAGEMDRLIQEITKLRSDAQTDASNAATHFDGAYKAADDLRRDLQKKIGDNPARPEVPAWKDAQNVMEPMQFKLQEAAAQRTLGELYGSQAASAQRRIDLRDLLAAATSGTNLTVPSTVTEGDLNKDRQTALDLADEAYKASDSLLSDIVEGSAEDIKGTAHLSRALTQYGWSQVSRLAGNEQQGKEHIESAIQQRNAAVERNIPIPAMPAELGPPPKPAAAETAAPTTEPTTAPATEPATAPTGTEGAAPATPPAQ